MNHKAVTLIVSVLVLATGCFAPSSPDVSPSCGDGFVNRGEECDRGDDNSDRVANACRMDCRLPTCGDGVVDRDETCDDLDATCILCQRIVNCGTGNDCFDPTTCENLDGGGVTCGACPEGLEGDGVTCTEIDGCADNPCSPGVECIDIAAPGTGFSCGGCPPGLEGDGEDCTEIDGCRSDPCFSGVECTDVPAPGNGFVCGECPPGLEGDGVTCSEIDGCASSPCDEGIACTDVPSPGEGFVCACEPGLFRPDPGEGCRPLLDDIELSAGVLSPAFSPAQTNYSVELSTLPAEIRITPLVPDGVEVTLNGSPAVANVSSDPIDLLLGVTEIEVTVRANGVNQSYVIEVGPGPAQFIKASNPGASDSFGGAIALFGDTLAVVAGGGRLRWLRT